MRTERYASGANERENRLKMLTCPKGKERISSLKTISRSSFFTSTASLLLRFQSESDPSWFEYMELDIGGRYEECCVFVNESKASPTVVLEVQRRARL